MEQKTMSKADIEEIRGKIKNTLFFQTQILGYNWDILKKIVCREIFKSRSAEYQREIDKLEMQRDMAISSPELLLGYHFIEKEL